MHRRMRCMKTKLFLALGIIGLAAATTAPKAHAGGLSIDISFGIPVRYHPPVVVLPPPPVCPPPRVVCPPPPPPACHVVMASPICRPVIYAPPVSHHNHWNRGRGHSYGHGHRH